MSIALVLVVMIFMTFIALTNSTVLGKLFCWGIIISIILYFVAGFKTGDMHMEIGRIRPF